MNRVINLAYADFKLIFRDPSLRTFLALPALLFVLVIWLLPYLVGKYDFLGPYVPVMLVVCAIENTQMFCFVSGMVLIDEKENNVASVYGVVPLNPIQYIVSRFLFPYFFTVLLNVLLFAVQPFYAIGWADNLIISLLAALIVPLYALTLNLIADNRMKGLVYIKALNIVVLLPIAAFFVPDKWTHLFGIIPTHWIYQSIEHVALGMPAGWMWAIGFLFFSGLILIASRLFLNRHFA